MYIDMRVQGIELAASLSKVDLPDDCQVVETDGLPEAHRDGVAFLVSTKGKLYPRVVNNGRHVAISIPKKPAKVTPSQKHDTKSRN